MEENNRVRIMQAPVLQGKVQNLFQSVDSFDHSVHVGQPLHEPQIPLPNARLLLRVDMNLLD